jgi:hypothetical protein
MAFSLKRGGPSGFTRGSCRLGRLLLVGLCVVGFLLANLARRSSYLSLSDEYPLSACSLSGELNPEDGRAVAVAASKDVTGDDVPRKWLFYSHHAATLIDFQYFVDRVREHNPRLTLDFVNPETVSPGWMAPEVSLSSALGHARTDRTRVCAFILPHPPECLVWIGPEREGNVTLASHLRWRTHC